MASEGPNGPGAGANDASVGTFSWIDADKVTNEGIELSTCSTTSSGTSNYLLITDFGFGLPVGATVDGIVVEVNRARGGFPTNTVTDSEIKIIKGGVIGATNKASGTAWGALSYATYGTSTDLWGETWLYSDINDASFGIAISCAITFVSGIRRAYRNNIK